VWQHVTEALRFHYACIMLLLRRAWCVTENIQQKRNASRRIHYACVMNHENIVTQA
jgi:hypothetical protein